MSTKKTRKIAYEKHPVSPERKAKLRADGYVIIDEIYKPKDEAPETAAAGAAETRRTEPPVAPAAEASSENKNFELSSQETAGQAPQRSAQEHKPAGTGRGGRSR